MHPNSTKEIVHPNSTNEFVHSNFAPNPRQDKTTRQQAQDDKTTTVTKKHGPMRLRS